MTRRRALCLALATMAAILAGGAICCRRDSGDSLAVLLVTLDTTRADRIGAYGSQAGLTPNLDELARRGLLFERAFAVAPMTLPAHASLFTGLVPPRTGLRWNGEHRLRPEAVTLATRFQEDGFATAAFVSAAVLDSAFGLDRGFDRYDDEVGATGGPFKAERTAAATVARALTWLEAQDGARRLFLWVHLFEPHEPYQPPAPFSERFANDPYAGEIAAADAALTPLLAHRRFRAGSSSIVTALADHGESLGEHGEETHALLLHDAVLRVPWILATSRTAPGRIGAEVSQVDVAPTLLALAGLPPLPSSDGRALLSESGDREFPRGRTTYAESLYGQNAYGWAALRSLRRDGWKLVRGARDQLFETSSDPRELRDRRAVARAEEEALARALELVGRDTAPAPAAAVDRALGERLSSLGYLSPEGVASGTPDRLRVDPRDMVAVHEQFRELDRHLAAGEIDQAQLALRDVLAADPDNAFARRALEAELRSALARATDADSRLRLELPLAQLLAGGERRDEAQALLAGIAESPATSAAAVSARAYARLELGRTEAARADWEALAALFPSDPSPRLNLASLALAERRFAVAERWAGEAVELAPASAAAHNALAIAIESQGRATEAERAYERALALDPSYLRSELNLALLRAARGATADRERATAALERVLARSPREPMALWASGGLAFEAGDPTLAAERWQAFLEVAPRHSRAPEVRRRLATLGNTEAPRAGR